MLCLICMKQNSEQVNNKQNMFKVLSHISNNFCFNSNIIIISYHTSFHDFINYKHDQDNENNQKYLNGACASIKKKRNLHKSQC